MPPAIVAIAAAVATAAVHAFVTSALLAAILTVAISVAATLLVRKPKGALNQGQEVTLKLDPTMPRQIALGRTATGGSLVWAFTYTDNGKKPNRYLVRIIALSDLPINGCVEIREGKNVLSFASDVHTTFAPCNQHKDKKGNTCMWVVIKKGSPAAIADAGLISMSGGLWTSAHKGTNIAYAIVRYDYDADAFPNGEPQLIFTIDGVSCYDDRLDSTKPGGSGFQRVDNPTTWTYTRNAAVLAAQVLRGFYSNGVLILGAQAEERDLDPAMLFSAYNTCDQSVTTLTTTIPRYRAGMMANSRESVANTLLELQAAFDGRIMDRGGAITLRPGASHTPVFDLTDDDIIWTHQKSWQPRASLTDLINNVVGTFVNEATGFHEAPFPSLFNSTWETQDGGERFTASFAFRAITSDPQVQRITKRVHDASRFQGTVSFVLPIWAVEIEQGDWFTMSSTRWGFSGKYFEVATADLVFSDELAVAITAREVSPTFSSWNYAVDEQARSDTTWVSPPYVLILPDFALAAHHRLDATSLFEVVGIELTITNAIEGAGPTAIEVELAFAADHSLTWSAGIIQFVDQLYIIDNLIPNTLYSLRIRTTDGKRTSDWSAWVDQQTTAISTLVDYVDGKTTTFIQSTPPTAAESNPNDIWLDTANGNFASYRIAGDGLLHDSFGNIVTDGAGHNIEAAWAYVDDQRIAQAILDAATAQGVADGKVDAWTLVSAGDPLPAFPQVGDLLYRIYLSPPQVDRWSGTAWVALATYGASAAQIAAITAAQTAADNAQTAANTAQTTANTAITTLTNIANDNLLTPNEKGEVLVDYTALTTEQAGIDAQATSYSITTEKTPYDTAVSALITYMATLTTPVLWSDVSGNTTIVGTTFRTKFTDVYNTRQTLLNKIAAEAGLRANWATISNIPYDQILNNDDSTTLGFNGSFESWTGAYPTGWINWSGAAPTKETTIVRYGTNAVRYTATGSDLGFTLGIGWPLTPMPVGSFVSGNIDFYLVSRTSGLPGILVRLYTNAANTTYVDTLVQPPSTTISGWQSVPWAARVGAGQQIYAIQIYVMASWGGFVTGGFTGTVIFDRLNFAFFNASLDNKQVTIAANGTLSGGGGGTVTISGLGYVGDLDATNGAPTGTNVGGIPAGSVGSTINSGGGVAPNQVNTLALIDAAITKAKVIAGEIGVVFNYHGADTGITNFGSYDWAGHFTGGHILFDTPFYAVSDAAGGAVQATLYATSDFYTYSFDGSHALYLIVDTGSGWAGGQYQMVGVATNGANTWASIPICLTLGLVGVTTVRFRLFATQNSFPGGATGTTVVRNINLSVTGLAR